MATPNFGSRVPQILSRIPHWGTGLLVLSLLGCATNLPPSSPPPEATEELKQTPELPDSPDATVPETNAVESSQGLTPVAIAPPLPQTELWSLLQQQEAPYFVLMRHALAPGTGDPATFQVDDCATQRNLSAEGRAQAAGTGDAFRQQNVAVDRVLSSQWCRCLDTAALLGLGMVEPFPPLNSFFSDRSTEPAQTAQVQQFMLEQQGNPGVIVMVTHFVNISAMTDIGPPSGEMVVMRLNDQNQLEVLGAIAAL